VRLLIDTHLFVWTLIQPDRLGDPRDLIEDASNDVFVSAATVWELSIKKAKGALTCPDDMVAQISEKGFQQLPISAHHGDMAARLPMLHRDPFDRMLVAQAMAEGLILLTHDRRLAAYGPFVRVV
jgi:PIN domain nuclease of toxin-antitoxin system